MKKHYKILLLLCVLFLFSACAQDPGPTVIDLCDGEREFLDIPGDADILFTAGMYGDDLNDPAEIYAMDVDSRTVYRISCSNYSGPSCFYAGPHASPDRKRIVVMRGCADTSGDGMVNFRDRTSVWVIDVRQDTAVEVTGFNSVNSPEWSLQDRIVFAANLPGALNTDIYVMDSDGTNIINLTDSSDFFENDPGWSHDGQRIVYNKGAFTTPAGMDEGTFIAALGDLWVMNADGTDKTKVVSFGGNEACEEYSDNFCKGLPADPAFLPGDEGIVFEQLLSVEENQGSGCWNIFSASREGPDRNITNLTDHPTAYQVIPHASERGIIFHETDTARPFYGLVLTDLDGTGRTEIIDNSNWSYYLGSAAWLPK